MRAVSRGVAQNNLNKTNPMAGLVLGVASAVAEGADTRTWRTLPDMTQVTRLRLKHGEHQVSLPNALGGTLVTVKADQRYQVITLRVVGNLPYNISTPLLFHLADYAETVYDMHFMLQKEVVERMVSEPGDADFGRLSVMLQYRFWMEWLIDVPPESFDPAPKVDSAVVRLIPKPLSDLRAKSLDKLGKVVLQAFSQRRKMLRNTLKGTLDDTGFAALGIDPTRRAEDIPVEDYVRIANYLSR